MGMGGFPGLRAVFIGAAGMAVATLAACGPAPGKSDSAETATSASPVAAVSGAPPQAAPFTPPVDPDKDDRPDRIKVDDFATRIDAQQDALVAADAAFIQNARTALQSGSPDGAHSALMSYQATIQGQIAALPQPPRLNGCFDRAKATGDQARDAAMSALSDRKDKIRALTAVAYRPLSLADFGPLATAAAAQPQAAAQAKALLQQGAQRAVAACNTAATPAVGPATIPTPASRRAATPSRRAQSPAESPRQRAQIAYRRFRHSPPPRRPAQQPPTFFNRLFDMPFSG